MSPRPCQPGRISLNTPISVVIPTHNRAHLLPRAINSALREIQPYDEILVIDDDSTDGTAAVVKQYGRVRYLKKKRGGAGPARNLGISESCSPLIAFLDSDDEWLPGKLALQRRLMEALPEVDYCFSDFRVVNSDGKTYPRYLQQWHQDPRPWSSILGKGELYSSIAPLPHNHPDFMVHQGNLYPQLMERPYIATFTLLYRKDTEGDPPFFMDDLPIYEDWEFFGRLARGRKGAFLDCETAIQHGHDGARLTQARVLTQVQARLKLIRRLWGTDETFLQQHDAQYGELIRKLEAMQRFYTAKELLRTGKMRAAREAFRSVENYPALYRFLLMTPGFVMRAADRVRKPSGF